MIRNKDSANKDYIPFKILYDTHQRKQKYKKVMNSLDKNRDLVLIILEPHPKTQYKSLIIRNCKFSCQACHTVNYIKQQLMSRYKKENEDVDIRNISAFLYCEKSLLVGDRTLGSIRDQYRDKDGFLYITYAEMDVYG